MLELTERFTGNNGVYFRDRADRPVQRSWYARKELEGITD